MRARVWSIVAGLLLGLVLAEGIARLVVPPIESAHVVDSGYAQRLEQENAAPQDLSLSDSVVDGGVLYFWTPTGMRLRANTHAIIQHHHLGGNTVDIKTNSLGHRGPELGAKTRTRVLFIGDSITVQDYLPEQQTMVHLVQQLSEKTSEPLETINAGVGAIGLANELALFMETGLQTQPDVVVLNWYLNDVQASAGVQSAELTGILAYSRLLQAGARATGLLASPGSPEAGMLDGGVTRRDHGVFNQEIDQQWRADFAARFPRKPGGDYRKDPEALRTAFDLFFDWGSGFSEGAWETMRPLFAEFARQSKLHDFRLLFVAFPVTYQIEAEYVQDWPQQQLQKIGAELGVPVLDLLPFLRRAQRESKEPLFWDWCHPSPLGSRLIAEQLLAFIQANTSGGAVSAPAASPASP